MSVSFSHIFSLSLSPPTLLSSHTNTLRLEVPLSRSLDPSHLHACVRARCLSCTHTRAHVQSRSLCFFLSLSLIDFYLLSKYPTKLTENEQLLKNSRHMPIIHLATQEVNTHTHTHTHTGTQAHTQETSSSKPKIYQITAVLLFSQITHTHTHAHTHTHTLTHTHTHIKPAISGSYTCVFGTSGIGQLVKWWYGVATISRLLKIIGPFAEYNLFYRTLLQKRPAILRSLPIVATPYQVKCRILRNSNPKPWMPINQRNALFFRRVHTQTRARACARSLSHTHTHTHTHAHTHTHTALLEICFEFVFPNCVWPTHNTFIHENSSTFVAQPTSVDL